MVLDGGSGDSRLMPMDPEEGWWLGKCIDGCNELFLVPFACYYIGFLSCIYSWYVVFSQFV